MTVERIKLDPKELVELVEDQLAWLAIASNNEDHRYVRDDFLRAESCISIGKHCVGVLDVEGVEADDATDWFKKPEEERIDAFKESNDVESHMSKILLPHLGERLSTARMIQCNPDEPSLTWCGGAHGLRDSDYEVPGDTGLVTSLYGLNYKLQSVALVPKKLLGNRLKKGIPHILFQEVAAFRDGRSVSSQFLCVLSDGKLVEPQTGKLLDSFMKEADSDISHPMSVSFNEAVIHQFTRRREWTVELSLSEDRTGIGLSTDANGARALVNSLGREPTKGGRRAALVHWVREHYRKRKGGGEPSFVKSHFRGKRACISGGLWAQVYPSRDDVDRIAYGEKNFLETQEKMRTEILSLMKR